MRIKALLCCIIMISALLGGCSGESEKEKEKNTAPETEATVLSDVPTDASPKSDDNADAAAEVPLCAFCGSGEHVINECPHLLGTK